MKWKFWDRSPEEKPEIPDDITYFQADRQGTSFAGNGQRGHVPTKASVKGMIAVAVVFALVVVVGFLWLYFHSFLFSNDT